MTADSVPTDKSLLTPREVTALLHIDSRTLNRWAATGRLQSIRTLGGHRRYPVEAIQALHARLAARDSTTPDEQGRRG